MAKNDNPKNPEKVSPDDVRAYLRTRIAQFDAKKNLAGMHAKTREDFVDGTGFNKTALGFMERLNRMTPEVRADILRSIDLIRTAMGGVWGQQPDMFDGDETEAPPATQPEDPSEPMKRARTSAKRAKAAEKAKEREDATALQEPPVERAPDIGADIGTTTEAPKDGVTYIERLKAQRAKPVQADDDFLGSPAA